MKRILQVIGILSVGCLLVATANASVITGNSDPDYNTLFQGASAATFAGLGYSIGTGATDLKVHTELWTDPSGFVFGSVSGGQINGYGFTFDPLGYGYGGGGSAVANGNARDYYWNQNAGTNFTTNPALDTPWNGTIWDLGGQANQAVVFPIVDHGPLPQEAVEYTVYLTNTPGSTNLSDWSLAVLDSVYMQGWQADNVALADGFTTVWKLAGNATFRYVSVQGIGSGAIQTPFGDEDEIDAVAGLTASGQGVAVPEPATLLLLATGLGAISRKLRS